VLIAFEPDQAATLSDGRKRVRECLTDHGYAVTGNFVSPYHVQQPAAGSRLSVFAGIFEGDAISWYPGKRGALTRAMIFPPSYHNLLNRPCPIPREPENYLTKIYGPKWKAADPHFRHRWKPAPYRDIR
jgi:hypothetical protein